MFWGGQSWNKGWSGGGGTAGTRGGLGGGQSRNKGWSGGGGRAGIRAGLGGGTEPE